ncbi:MAG TPA: DUF1761 domain-containing protein [Gemmatimonadales bacterium]|nr:DUF1761 domain-containing protein [Gemmatimonadales bacterium]
MNAVTDITIIGGLWYSPVLFAKQWVAAHGYTPEQVAAMQKGAPKAYGISFLCFLLMAHVLGFLVHLTGAATWLYGAHLGFLCWLGFALTIGLTAQVYSQKRFAAFVIDAGYQLVYLVAMGTILAAWQ